MIKICFPPGCYGHYLSQCLWYFTDVSDSEIRDFVIDSNGSSHAFRKNHLAKKHIQIGHMTYITSAMTHPATLTVNQNDKCITICPVEHNWLDYYNNQYVKQSKSNLISFIGEQTSIDEIKSKLQTQWGYYADVDSDVPRWIMRELWSYYIADILHSGYAYDRCLLKDSIRVSASMFFKDFIKEFKNLCRHLDLKIMTTDQVLQNNNDRFQILQKHHDSQNRCKKWVEDLLADRDSPVPIHTIFDEAYIQHMLRLRGFEIQCDGLNQFPSTSVQMRSLIYKL